MCGFTLYIPIYGDDVILYGHIQFILRYLTYSIKLSRYNHVPFEDEFVFKIYFINHKIYVVLY